MNRSKKDLQLLEEEIIEVLITCRIQQNDNKNIKAHQHPMCCHIHSGHVECVVKIDRR